MTELVSFYATKVGPKTQYIGSIGIFFESKDKYY